MNLNWEKVLSHIVEKKELSKMIMNCPAAFVFPGACWRTPMIQHLIQKKLAYFIQ